MLDDRQSNIYNKVMQTKDGTLINNWYEEGELRRLTGEGRATMGTNFRKTTFDPEVVHTNDGTRDNTFKRVIGVKEPQDDYFTTNSLYGTKTDELERYTHPKFNQGQNLEEFNKYLQTTINNRKEEEKGQREFRSFDTTTTSVHVPQPFFNYVGLRHMKTQDLIEIPREKAINFIPIEKLKKMGVEAAQAEMEEKQRKKEAAQKAAASGTSDDTPMSFWLSKINTSDMYRSFLKGTNPWYKSSAFTQPIQRTRGALTFYQNAFDSQIDQNFLNAAEEERKKYEEMQRLKKEGKLGNTMDTGFYDAKPTASKMSKETAEKILKGMKRVGWCGLRLLKVYLRGLSGHKTEIIDKNGLKYHLAQKGILLNDEDMNGIFAEFDINKSDSLNFIDFLNSLRYINDNRIAQIESFKEQVKVPGQTYISYTSFRAMADMSFHPEVLRFSKTIVDANNEYNISWDNLKEDDRIEEDQFREFFLDVSTCVDTDEDFTQILKALGYK